MTRCRAVCAFVFVVLLSACTGRAARQASFNPVASNLATSDDERATERTIVREATLRVELATLDSARQRAIATVSAMGARLERESLRTNTITLRLRVPEATLDSAIVVLSALGRDLGHRITSTDHTLTAADLDARVQNLRASRDRLRALAARAESVADVVSVERELTRVQSELDGLEAQLRVLRDQAAMATLDVTFERRMILGPLGLVVRGVGIAVTKLFVWR